MLNALPKKFYLSNLCLSYSFRSDLTCRGKKTCTCDLWPVFHPAMTYEVVRVLKATYFLTYLGQWKNSLKTVGGLLKDKSQQWLIHEDKCLCRSGQKYKLFVSRHEISRPLQMNSIAKSWLHRPDWSICTRSVPVVSTVLWAAFAR